MLLEFALSGKVIGPTFQFSPPEIDFGAVPFGFLSSADTTMENTSAIPMGFNLHSADMQLTLTPAKGVLGSGEKVQVSLDLLPLSCGKLQTNVSVDVQNVGIDMLRVPVLAAVNAPVVRTND